MIIKINAIDKMFINNLLPQAESILIQIMARDISRKIEISEKDRKAINLRPSPQGGLLWNVENIKKTATDTDFSAAEISMLQEQIVKLDKEKKVTPVMLETVLKIRDIKIEEGKPKKKKR